jgi:two-component system, cell cycle sensor histidine kinase and response regulator CckA
VPPDDTEERIRALEAEVRRLQALLESAPDFITRITVDGKFLYLNRLAPGFRMEDVVGTSVDNYVPPEHRERAHAAMSAARETQAVQQYATVGRISVDRIGHYLTRVSPVIEDGEVTSLVLIATDVTALEEQRILLQIALDAGGLGIWTYDPNSGTGTWDETARRIFGIPEGAPEPRLEQVMAMVHADDREAVRKGLSQLETVDRYGPLQHRIVRPSGEVRWVMASGLAVRDHAGRVANVVGSTQDITERRTLEARLLEAQKLESIGRLAGGIAHDFNNLLTAILGNLEFAQEADSLDDTRALLEPIRIAAERSAALTAQLLAFARRQVIEPKVLDPNPLVRRLEGLFQRTIGENIRTHYSLEARGRVKADESQLEQVVMNLVTNARDAMPNGGELTVETRDVELRAEQTAAQTDVAPGRYVMIGVSDTGPGIAPDTLPHVFEPFFTTRAGGTGLGLATCYGIVKQSGGHIGVHSELGSGATFKVYLPRADEEPGSSPISPPKPGAAAGERVLIVEDEAAVRAVVERTLRKQGYHVMSVGTAEEALELSARSAPFDLLVTDVVLPGMNGRQLAQQLASHGRPIRALFVSGYSEDAIVRGGVLEPGISFLQKPFQRAELLAAVRKLLELPKT